MDGKERKKREEVKRFLKGNPEEAEHILKEIGLEQEIQTLEEENKGLKDQIRRDAISFGRQKAKLIREINKLRDKAGLPPYKERKRKSRKKPEPEPDEPEPEEREEEEPEPEPKTVEPLSPESPKEEKKSLSKRAKEAAKKKPKGDPTKSIKKFVLTQIIWTHQQTADVCPRDIIVKEAQKKDIPEDDIDGLLEEMKDEGRIYEKEPGRYRAVAEPDEKGFFDEEEE